MQDTSDIVIAGSDDIATVTPAKTVRDIVGDGARSLVQSARDNPRTAIATGAAALVGVIAVAAIPALRTSRKAAAPKASPKRKAPAKPTGTPKRAAAQKSANAKSSTVDSSSD